MLDSAVMSARYRMTSQELTVREPPSGSLDDRLLGAPNIRQHRLRLGDLGRDVQRFDNRLDRDAGNHQIGILGPHQNIVRCLIDCSATDRNVQAARRASYPDDLLGQAFAMECQPDRTTQEPYSNDANTLKNHEI
jgi:hypothetical protein